jgi:hypothetical protein
MKKDKDIKNFSVAKLEAKRGQSRPGRSFLVKPGASFPSISPESFLLHRNL